MTSVQFHHPEWERYVLLVDEVEDRFNPRTESFQLVSVSEIGIPDLKPFLFQYNILEANTAAKPWVFDWLFQQGQYQSVIYLDPDIFLYDRLSEVEEYLDAGKFMVLTPHLTGPLDDDKRPDELGILRAGTYNLGFLALSNHPETERFLKWWQKKLERMCVVDFPNGLFVDQKWLDLAPGMFQDVVILRHPGYNAAYWNLKHRHLAKAGDNYTVNGQKLVFYHFSGIDPEDDTNLSKYQNRYQLVLLKQVWELAKVYIQQVLANGYRECRNWGYGYGRFEDGTSIPGLARIAYREALHLRKNCRDNPFRAKMLFLTLPVEEDVAATRHPLVTHTMYQAWKSDEHLKTLFPEPLERNRSDFCRWFAVNGVQKFFLPEDWLAPLKEQLREQRQGSGLDVRSRRFLRLKSFLFWKIYCLTLAVNRGIGAKINPRLKKKIKCFIERRTYVQNDFFEKADSRTVVVQSGEMKKEQQLLGVNLVGYARAEMGIGESCRLAAGSLDASGIPFGIINFEIGNPGRMRDHRWRYKEISRAQYRVNIFHINADQMPVAFKHLGRDLFDGRYNIGFWHWELPEFPEEWTGSFKLVDEVWVPSRFVQDSIARKSPVPVVRIPHAIEINCPPDIDRRYFNLPESFLFLAMYDVYSQQERKNPRSVIEAFQKTFGPGDFSAGLVLKVTNPRYQPEEISQLKEMVGSYKNIYLIDEVLKRQELNALINVIDCFVSLHRSEGFGLGLAEAMYLGKPVIGTNWSSNIDFMNSQNSCPVNYQIIKVGQDHGPYKAHQFWAEPDVEHASYFMKKLATDSHFHQMIGSSGQKTIHTEYSPKVVGRMIKDRLERLSRL
jgi:glycosyltransferase involved in cell wall biosynthesis